MNFNDALAKQVKEEAAAGDIQGFGAAAALRELGVYWSEHIKDGCDPLVILNDIDDVVARLQAAKGPLTRRYTATEPDAIIHAPS